MKTQQNSILSIIQIQDNGCLVNDVAKQHGGKQMIMIPNCILLPLIYLKHYQPTAKQMCDISREEVMTSKSDWDLSKLDDIEGAADLHIQQFPLLLLMLLIASTTHKATFAQTKVIWKMIMLSVMHQM